MSVAQSLVRSLFSVPGRVPTDAESLRRQAAKSHGELLSLAASRTELRDRLAPIKDFLASSAPSIRKRRLLCHPLFVEGLHSLSPFSIDLERWHDRVTSSPQHPPADPAAIASLGNVALAILLQSDRSWCGRCELCTDVLGRLGFPFSDWTFLLCNNVGAPLSCRAVSLTLDRVQACWRISDDVDHTFLVMPRDECVRMIIDGAAVVDEKGMLFPDPAVHLKMTCACRLGRSGVRYDPVGFPDDCDHAAVAGGLIAGVLAAIRCDSPIIYREFRTYIRTVRGYEFPRAACVASFSDPISPGVIGMSVAYSDDGEPCLDPFCFTWFGHEMGHTKNYLTDNILYARGTPLATNARDCSNSIPRYGRPLSVRTLLQIPYVHLYEWELLMDFIEANFRGLPWKITGGAAAVGNDFAAEIEESFDHIQHWSRLTPLGFAAVDHFHHLFDTSKLRWQSLHVTA